MVRPPSCLSPSAAKSKLRNKPLTCNLDVSGPSLGVRGLLRGVLRVRDPRDLRPFHGGSRRWRGGRGRHRCSSRSHLGTDLTASASQPNRLPLPCSLPIPGGAGWTLPLRLCGRECWAHWAVSTEKNTAVEKGSAWASGPVSEVREPCSELTTRKESRLSTRLGVDIHVTNGEAKKS